MSSGASVDPAAIDEAARAFVRYATAEEAVMASADRAIQRAVSHARSEQRRRRADVAAAEAALRACQSKREANCSAFAAAVRRAQTRLDCANRAVRDIDAAANRYRAAETKHKAVVRGLVRNGRAHLSRKSVQLGAYMAGGSGGGAGGGGAPSDVRRATLRMISSAMVTEGAKFAAISLATGGIEHLLHAAGAFNGTNELIDDALSAVQDSPLGAHFEQIGDALSHIRRQLHG